MQKTYHFFLTLLVFSVYACVKPKVYRSEVLNRRLSEARDSVHVKELTDRKAENTALVERVGELNRTIGNQETLIADLRADLNSRTQQMGESASKLLGEKIALEKELQEKNKQLSARTAMIQRIKKAQEERRLALDDLANALRKAYEGAAAAKDMTTIEVAGETVVLTFQDKNLFDAVGLTPSAACKDILTPLAGILSQRPELDADIVSHTDNTLPKDKSIKDTWDWSIVRATNLTRLLIKELSVNANQLMPVGKGEFYPKTSNETPEGRQQNRRTAVVLKPVLPPVPAAEL